MSPFFFFFVTALAIDTSSSPSVTTSSCTASSSSSSSTRSSPNTILYKSQDYHLLEVVPHSTASFTQGLTSYGGHLYEGTGLEYKSQILQHDPSQDMKTVQSQMVTPNHVFGEGITYYFVDRERKDEGGSGEVVVREHRMIQLTWKNGLALIYKIHNPPNNNNNNDNSNNYPTWELINQHSFQTHTGEGWGITFIPHTNEFYVTDGSEYILVWDVETLQEKRRMAVTLERGGEKSSSNSGGGSSSSVRLKYLNELEFVDFGRSSSSSKMKERKKNENGDRGRRSVKDWDIHSVYLEPCQEGDYIMMKSDDNDPPQTTCSSSNTDSSTTTTEECNNNDDKDKGSFTSTMSILANVWYQDVLIRIDPVTAKITRVYDLSDIYPYEQRREDGADCLNGISVVTTSENSGGGDDDDEEEEEGVELWVTGKWWPKMYRIRLID
ncbi:hypothetical protein ACHAXM_004488 [Skeletonema potamos]